MASMTRRYLSIYMPTRFSIFWSDLCSPRAIGLFIRRVCLFTVELGSNRANVSVGEVCKILVLNRLNSPMPLYKVEDWANHVSLTSSGYLPAC